MRPAISDRRQATRPAGGQGWSGTSGREVEREGTIRADHLGNRSSGIWGLGMGGRGQKRVKMCPLRNSLQIYLADGASLGQTRPAGRFGVAEWERERQKKIS